MKLLLALEQRVMGERMAKANLLDTKTINFIELIGNGKAFEVPPFQRDYSWSEEQWEDLWNDIQSLRSDPDEQHYMGSLVVEAKSDRLFRIIDGQQRIATLSVFALAVIAHLLKLAREGVDSVDNELRANGLRSIFIGQKDPVSLTESSKLALNHTDKDFYQDNLVALREPVNPRALPKSNALLWDCWKWFGRKIAEDQGLATSGIELASLLNEVVARRLLFIQITVDDDMNAYTVFETLNARGLELSSTDLLKNYLFSRIQSPADLAALDRRWRVLVGTVRQERFPEFLRYHLLCEYRQIRQQRLFKLIRNEVKRPEQVFQLITALESRAELYSALFDVSHGFWIDLPENRTYIRQLQLFGVRQMTPLVFAAWERFSAQDFTRVLKILTAISFRYTVIGEMNPNELEPVYHTAAKAVLGRSVSSPKGVFELLLSVYVTDDRFRSDFASVSRATQGASKKIVKYILSRLETDARGTLVSDDVDAGTIEHILPENASPEWEVNFPQKQMESNVYRLGNLSLLESNLNRAIGNAEYATKVVEYRQSHYYLSRAIADEYPEEWTPAMIGDRQGKMASRAVHVWRVDFDV